jgi:D-aspartate ligase
MDRRGAVVLGGAHGALALARSLGPSGVPVVQITNDSPLPGWSRHVQRQIAWPGPHDDNAVAFLLKVAKEEGWDSDLLVPAGDAEVELVSRHIDTLATAYTIALPDWDALKWVCEKPLLYRRSARTGDRHTPDL